MTTDDWIEYRADDESTWPPTTDKYLVLEYEDLNLADVLYFDRERILTGEISDSPWLERDRITHYQPIMPLVKRRWMPKNGEMYSFLKHDLSVSEDGWSPLDYHASRRRIFGVYHTKEEAQQMIDLLTRTITDAVGVV